MKLDKYNGAQSSQSIESLQKSSFGIENYKDEVGQIYWKESDSSVSSKMSLKNRTNSRMNSKAKKIQTEGLVKFFAKASEFPNTLRYN